MIMRILLLAAIASLANAQSFEVASIKPSEPGGRGMQIQIAPGGRFTAKGASVRLLIQQAYGVRDFQITGAPGWTGSERYDITAKAEGGSDNITQDQLKIMIQGMLADRFKLTFHRETKELPMYTLVVAKNGPKLQEADAANSRPMMRMGRGLINADGAPMSIFVTQLSNQLGRSVTDKTGLTGNYNFKLEWTPDQNDPRISELHPDAPPPVDSAGPTIFTALQEQLGLKLEAQKGPVEILVIDRIEKATEN